MRYEEKVKFLNALKEDGFLDYGKIIPYAIFSERFDCTLEHGMEFIGPWLDFKEFLEENGYLCSSRSLEPGCLRIFDADEIAERADKLVHNHLNRMKRLQTCIANTHTQDFTNKEYKSVLHAANKITSALMALKSALKDI